MSSLEMGMAVCMLTCGQTCLCGEQAQGQPGGPSAEGKLPANGVAGVGQASRGKSEWAVKDKSPPTVGGEQCTLPPQGRRRGRRSHSGGRGHSWSVRPRKEQGSPEATPCQGPCLAGLIPNPGSTPSLPPPPQLLSPRGRVPSWKGLGPATPW